MASLSLRMLNARREPLAGGETHPFDIHEILLFYQPLDPGYALVV